MLKQIKNAVSVILKVCNLTAEQVKALQVFKVLLKRNEKVFFPPPLLDTTTWYLKLLVLPYPKYSYPQPGTGFILSPSLPIQYFALHLVQISIQRVACSSQICKSILTRNSTPQRAQHIHGAPDHHVHTVQHIFGVGFCWLFGFFFFLHSLLLFTQPWAKT